MGKLKERFYNSLVRKNGRVWYEYERYVREHLEEHHLHRFRHLKVLFKLNWFYRVKKGNTPYLYWDVPLSPVVSENILTKNSEKNQEVAMSPVKNIYCESQKYLCPLEVHLAKAFAKYDYIVLNIFDTLIYLCLNDKQNFYELIGKELGVPMFCNIRIKIEEELTGKAKINGKENSVNIEDIYREMEKYTKVDYGRGIEAEVRLLEKISKANPYIKSIFEMISYKSKNVFLIEDSIYSSEHLDNLLKKNGIYGYKDLLISNECRKSILDGTMFELLSKRLETKNILYIDNNLTRQKRAKAYGWDMWEYRDVKQLGNVFRIDGMSEPIRDLYSSIIAQHVYCGHYIYSIQYEVGFLYYGIFMVGFIDWVKAQIDKYNFQTVFFLEETSDLLKQCLEISRKDSKGSQNVLWVTEETAVRVLVGKCPIFFYEYYIKRYINSGRPISFYLGKMGLLNMASKLADYGLTLTDVILRDSIFYGAFIDFIEENLEEIKEEYSNERIEFCNYLKTLDIQGGNIAIVDVAGKGYVALAVESVLNEELNINCKVQEITAFQTIKSEDTLYRNWINSYLSSENVKKDDIKIIGSELVHHRTRNILSNIEPVFKNVITNANGELEFIYEEAYPWKYRGLEDNQQGILDFFKEYVSTADKCGVSTQVRSEDVLCVINHLFMRTEYISKAFTIMRS